MPDFALHDHHPEYGNRYGYQRTRQILPVTWTLDERVAAEALGIELPEAWWHVCEIWWNRPNRRWVEREYDEIEYTPTMPPYEVAYRQRVITAKRWACRTREPLRVRV